jgi:tetratricopeptide (TPR) repeat protein
MTENNLKQTVILPEAASPQQRRRIIQNYLLIWLDPNINEFDNDCQYTLEQFRSIVNDINIFSDVNQCIDFLTDIDNANVFMIIPGILGEYLLPSIHEIFTLNAIYILCNNKVIHEEWIKQWPKIKSVHTDITSIYQVLQKDTKQCDQNSVSISFIPATNGVINQNLDQLEPSFMYTQILKEILLEIKYDQKSIKEFTTYCRNGNYGALNNINRFEHEYRSSLAIWWYTQPSFIFSMINRALRVMEADTIIKMGFFIRDLHFQIQELNRLQINGHYSKPLTVYRGQGLSTIDFEKLMNTKDGLLSFNNFLSTSNDNEVAVDYAESALTDPNLIGIVFKMTIDASVSSAPFAAINEVSYFKTEEEVLFSMHTIFRVGKINMIDNNDRLYQVELKLTNDEDQELRILTEHIRQETCGSTGWERLGKLLVSIGQYGKAEDFFKLLLEQASNEEKKGLFYNQLGHISDHLGNYDKAIFCFDKSLEIKQKTLPPYHPALAASYNNIGEVYRKMAEYSQALLFYEKAIEISENVVPSDHFFSAALYNNIGLVYKEMAEYQKALSFMNKSLEIRLKVLPSNHPHLAICYGTMAVVYYSMGEHSNALSFYEKTLEIEQKSLPSNHPSFIISYHNIARLYQAVGQHSKALSYYEKAIQICQETLPSNHPLLPTCYSNMGSVYKIMRDYSKALSFYEKAIEIGEKSLPPNHPNLICCYSNITGLYAAKGEHSKALSIYEKTIQIYRKTHPSNHPLLATSYNNIGRVYQDMGNNSKALSYYEKALEIRQQILSPQHLDLAQSYNNIANVYYNTGNYSKALPLLEHALNICQCLLPDNHSHLQYVRTGIEMVKEKLLIKLLTNKTY